MRAIASGLRSGSRAASSRSFIPAALVFALAAACHAEPPARPPPGDAGPATTTAPLSLVGERVRPVPPAPGGAQLGPGQGLAYAAGVYLAAWTDHGFVRVGRFTPALEALDSPAGRLLVPEPSFDGWAVQPKVTAAGEVFVVTWIRREVPARLMALRLRAPDGAPLDAEPLDLGPVGYAYDVAPGGLDPAAADSVVVAARGPDADGRVTLAALGFDVERGAVAWRAELGVEDATSSPSPRIVPSGDGHAVAWTAFGDQGWEARLRRVEEDGGVGPAVAGPRTDGPGLGLGAAAEGALLVAGRAGSLTAMRLDGALGVGETWTLREGTGLPRVGPVLLDGTGWRLWVQLGTAAPLGYRLAADGTVTADGPAERLGPAFPPAVVASAAGPAYVTGSGGEALALEGLEAGFLDGPMAPVGPMALATGLGDQHTVAVAETDGVALVVYRDRPDGPALALRVDPADGRVLDDRPRPVGGPRVAAAAGHGMFLVADGLPGAVALTAIDAASGQTRALGRVECELGPPPGLYPEQTAGAVLPSLAAGPAGWLLGCADVAVGTQQAQTGGGPVPIRLEAGAVGFRRLEPAGTPADDRATALTDWPALGTPVSMLPVAADEEGWIAAPHGPAGLEVVRIDPASGAVGARTAVEDGAAARLAAGGGRVLVSWAEELGWSWNREVRFAAFDWDLTLLGTDTHVLPADRFLTAVAGPVWTGEAFVHCEGTQAHPFPAPPERRSWLHCGAVALPAAGLDGPRAEQVEVAAFARAPVLAGTAGGARVAFDAPEPGATVTVLRRLDGEEDDRRDEGEGDAGEPGDAAGGDAEGDADGGGDAGEDGAAADAGGEAGSPAASPVGDPDAGGSADTGAAGDPAAPGAGCSAAGPSGPGVALALLALGLLWRRYSQTRVRLPGT